MHNAIYSDSDRNKFHVIWLLVNRSFATLRKCVVLGEFRKHNSLFPLISHEDMAGRFYSRTPLQGSEWGHVASSRKNLVAEGTTIFATVSGRFDVWICFVSNQIVPALEDFELRKDS